MFLDIMNKWLAQIFPIIVSMLFLTTHSFVSFRGCMHCIIGYGVSWASLFGGSPEAKPWPIFRLKSRGTPLGPRLPPTKFGVSSGNPVAFICGQSCDRSSLCVYVLPPGAAPVGRTRGCLISMESSDITRYNDMCFLPIEGVVLFL